jgi:hypothetical protein
MLQSTDELRGRVSRVRHHCVSLARAAFAANAPLSLVGVGSLFLLAATVVGLLVDPRAITGAPAWLKPAKFAVSIALYSFTLLWFLAQIRGHARLVRLVSYGTALAFLVEIAAIVGQVVRGRTSHFNIATPLDAFIFERMRDSIVLLFLLACLAAILLLRQRLPDLGLAAALRGGLGLALVGMLAATLMTVPTPPTAAAFVAGQGGAHSVGVADGGPGLPIVGWSTVGGDLRVAHFVGLHALQVLPLLAWLLRRPRFAALGVGGRLALVRIAGWGYLGLILLLAWQALRGQSIIAPDAPTLMVAGCLLAATTLAALVGIGRARTPVQDTVSALA